MRTWRSLLVLVAITIAAVVAVGTAHHASASIPIVANPQLVSVRRLGTNPFPGPRTTPVADAEGLAYDPVRNTLWLSDDALGQVLEVNFTTGELITVVSPGQFSQVPSFAPGHPAAGVDRIYLYRLLWRHGLRERT